MKRRIKSYKYIYGILVVFIGIGFAYLTANLNINGIGSFSSQSWDIHFDNVVVDNTSYSPDTPTVSDDDLTITFASGLRIPGDYYKFNVDIVNDGSLDAMFDAVNVTANNDFSNYIDYTITHQSGESLAQYDLLPANSSQTVTVNFFYKDIDLEDLPTEEMELSFTLEFNYLMANENAKVVSPERFVITDSFMYIGQAIPSEVNVRRTPEEAMADWPDLIGTPGTIKPFYLKHIMSNGLISESYLEFIVTPEVETANPGMTAGTYSLRGYQTRDENTSNCKAEYYDSTTSSCMSPYFESNKATILSAVGSESYCLQYPTYYCCNVSDLYVCTSFDGDVYIDDDIAQCSINALGNSWCHVG